MSKRTSELGMGNVTLWGRAIGCAALAIAAVGFAPLALAQEDGDDEPALEGLEYAYHKIVPDSEAQCGQCHRKTVAAWKTTTHYSTWDNLHLNDRAQEIVEAMGGRSIKRSKICTQCHYTMSAREEGGRARAVMGVSCQRCHGPAVDWLQPHSDEKTEPDKAKRLAKCEELGMRPTYKLYELASSCFQCHTVPKEELVNKGGHKAGSDFELVAWSQGEVRHNFLPLPDEPANKERDEAYLKKLFVMGKLLDLEYSLKALAQATTDGAFKTAMVERVKKAGEGVKAIGSGSLGEVTGVVPGDPAAASPEDLKAAASKVSQVAKSLSDSNFSGFDFGNTKLPPKSEYKGTTYTG